MVKLDLKPSLSISLRRIRTHEEWNVDTHISRARRPTSASTRSFISAAALLVKVIARIEPGWARRSVISQAIRRVSTRVLPEPAPATTRSGEPWWVTAARCGSLCTSSSASAVCCLRRSCAVSGTPAFSSSGSDSASVIVPQPYVPAPPAPRIAGRGVLRPEQRDPDVGEDEDEQRPEQPVGDAWLAQVGHH